MYIATKLFRLVYGSNRDYFMVRECVQFLNMSYELLPFINLNFSLVKFHCSRWRLAVTID